jgi:hypothetical protein
MVWDVSLLPAELSSRVLSPQQYMTVFGVWLEARACAPAIHPVLYPCHLTLEPIPKYISGRTSYLRVRLAYYL